MGDRSIPWAFGNCAEPGNLGQHYSPYPLGSGGIIYHKRRWDPLACSSTPLAMSKCITGLRLVLIWLRRPKGRNSEFNTKLYSTQIFINGLSALVPVKLKKANGQTQLPTPYVDPLTHLLREPLAWQDKQNACNVWKDPNMMSTSEGGGGNGKARSVKFSVKIKYMTAVPQCTQSRRVITH